MEKEREHTKLQFKQKASETFPELRKNQNRTKKQNPKHLPRHLRGNGRDVRKQRGRSARVGVNGARNHSALCRVCAGVSEQKRSARRSEWSLCRGGGVCQCVCRCVETSGCGRDGSFALFFIGSDFKACLCAGVEKACVRVWRKPLQASIGTEGTAALNKAGRYFGTQVLSMHGLPGFMAIEATKADLSPLGVGM